MVIDCIGSGSDSGLNLFFTASLSEVGKHCLQYILLLLRVSRVNTQEEDTAQA
jgi:hypothetical protein